jgi:hypothetical protein
MLCYVYICKLRSFALKASAELISTQNIFAAMRNPRQLICCRAWETRTRMKDPVTRTRTADTTQALPHRVITPLPPRSPHLNMLQSCSSGERRAERFDIDFQLSCIYCAGEDLSRPPQTCGRICLTLGGFRLAINQQG